MEVKQTVVVPTAEKVNTDHPIEVLSYPKIVVDVSSSVDPASLVGLMLSTQDKAKLIKMDPCQPNQSVLELRKKEFSNRSRYCSQKVFVHEHGTEQKWVSYSLSTDSLFCIPCLFFTDVTSRGELARANQGKAFTSTGFSSWKKQHSVVSNHEMSIAHANANVAEVVFRQQATVTSCFEKVEQEETARQKAEVLMNRNNNGAHC